jgi:hypothetical protein
MGLNIEYIDGQTPLSDEEKEGLRISFITTREELDEFEQLNIEKAIQWTFGKKIKTEQLLSEQFIKLYIKKCTVKYGNGQVSLEVPKRILA